MDKIIGVTELRRRFWSVFDEIVRHQVRYVVTRAGRPEAVLIPYEHYVRSMPTDEVKVRQRLDALLARMARENAQYTDKEIEADLRAASRTTRSRFRK